MTIDWWTLGIQAVNVLILIWLLSRFFWRPVASMIEQRRSAEQAALDDAKAKQAEAEAALSEIEQVRSGFAKEREAILAEAKADAERLRAERLEAAAKEVAALAAEAKARNDKDHEAAQQAWLDRSAQLAVDIARQLAERLAGPAVRAAFLDWLVESLGALAPAERKRLTAPDARLELVSEAALEPEEQASCRKSIGKALGGKAEIGFAVDPGLIAGLELRSANLVVGNSWRDDLRHILDELAHDRKA